MRVFREAEMAELSREIRQADTAVTAKKKQEES